MQRNLLWLVFTLFYAVEEESVPWRRKAMALDHCLCTAFSQLGVVLSRPILSSYRFDAFAPFLLSPHYYSQSIGSQAEGHDLKKVG